MRGADAITLLRTALVFPVAYLIITQYDKIWVIVALIAVIFIMDVLDGMVAKRAMKMGRRPSQYGARLDIAGDRVTEYVFWATFVYVSVIPLFVLFIIFIRNSFVDALMGAKGTSSEMKTKFARLVFSSNIGRGGVGVVKAVTFSYLAGVYVAGWDAFYGNVLVAILVVYVLLRGAAELYESFSN